MAAEQKRMGRPTKVADPGTRVSLGLKVTSEVKAKLDAAARSSGRTQSQEAELRLERSFSEEALIEKLFGGLVGIGPMEMMIAYFHHEGEAEAKMKGHPEWSAADWLRDPECYRAATLGALAALIQSNPGANWENMAEEEVNLMAEMIKMRIKSHIIRKRTNFAGEFIK